MNNAYYKFKYDPEKDVYILISFSGELDSWIRTHSEDLWSFEYCNNPSFFRTEYVIRPELMTLLRLKWQKFD